MFKIDTQSTVPIYEQLRNQVVYAIASGKLKAGETLPSVRKMADMIEINFHTVNKAYAALNEEGYIIIDRRKGAVVNEQLPDLTKFHQNLSNRVGLAAAEAICCGIDDMSFVSLCMQAYRDSKEGKQLS